MTQEPTAAPEIDMDDDLLDQEIASEDYQGDDEDEASIEGQGGSAREVSSFSKRNRIYTSPNAGTRIAKWRTFSSHAELLEYAAEMGADMRMGLYVDARGRRWKPRAPNFREIMRRLEYGRAYTTMSRYPAWWPKRGAVAFLEYVDLKVRLRREMGGIKIEAMAPWLETIAGLAMREITQRLTTRSGDYSDRDLGDLLSRTLNVLGQTQRQRGDLPVHADGMPKSRDGQNIYVAILNQARESLPEGVARDQMTKLWEETVQGALREVGGGVKSLPRTIETRSKRESVGA